MKIIQFIVSIDKTDGGTTAYMQLISDELKYLVELVVVSGISPLPIKLPGIKVLFKNFALTRWFSLKREFYEILKSEKPDLVHINGIWTPQNWLFQKEAQKLGIKVILSPHGMLEPYILRRHPLKKKVALALYQNWAIKNADYIHGTADSELVQFRKLGYNRPTAVIPNGINILEVKQKTEWNTNRKNILFLSRIHPKKGIEILIEAIALIKPNLIKITIAGEGDPNYIETLKKRTLQKGISHLVDFIGGVYGDQKWELFQKADIFILPTFSENFGIVIAEALATGIPVITTQGTPWHELETHHCGWWIDLNVQNLTTALIEAISKSPEELKAMGLRGRKLVEEKYDIKAIAQSMNEFYEWILKKGSRPKFIKD